MLSRLLFRRLKYNSTSLNGIVRNYSVSNASTNSNSSFTLKRYIKGTLFGITAGAIIYDGFNEFEVYGGVSRFLRSLKIAALISIDYTWNLYGLEESTNIYDQVSNDTKQNRSHWTFCVN